MPKRTRERQLAMLAARRQAERARQRRRRNLVLGAVGVVVAAVLLVVGYQCVHGQQPLDRGGFPQPLRVGLRIDRAFALRHAHASRQRRADEAHVRQPPPMTIDTSKTYTATFQTTCGTFTAQLLPKVAPIGVNNFVFLANKGFYDGLKFHRIVPNFVIQGGDPKGDGTGGPGYKFKIETSAAQTFDSAGLLAYANSGPDTNESQFFVTLAATPNLNPSANGSYTIFGKVTKGLDVVQKIGSVPTVAGPACAPGDPPCSPTEPIFILKVTIAEK
jgi:cyclophilin family peptidyl-prolyl cis-trans isomerase